MMKNRSMNTIKEYYHEVLWKEDYVMPFNFLMLKLLHKTLL